MLQIHARYSLWVISSCLVTFFTTTIALAPTAHAQKPAEWTILVFMNAKNNLEQDGINDFLEMAKIGSQSSVNLVVQLGRPRKKKYSQDYGGWSGVKRYLIKKDAEPTADSAVMTLTSPSGDVDMGSPDTLEDFVRWGITSYPAKKYGLIIWNHGQGWRMMLSKTQEAHARPNDRPGIVGGFRSVSHDSDTDRTLYNSEIFGVLSKIFTKRKLDFIGFDACLMAMVETGIALHRIATVMVASQELEPGAGWQHDLWLQKLTADPGMNGENLAREIVAAYRMHYGDQYKTTLSSVKLDQVEAVADTLSRVAEQLLKANDSDFAKLMGVRGTIASFGQPEAQPNYVDIDLFLERLAKHPTAGTSLKVAVAAARNAVAKAIAANYRSKRMEGDYGSNGLSVFFPESPASFLSDPDRAGYYPSNRLAPVEFVATNPWACVVLRFVKQRDPKCMH